ncbi:MAG: hypothetical protein FWF12_00655 [Betaproteobacteria bacterium]|nr:hypothetical protein [Betaproteobacteria bacterium]
MTNEELDEIRKRCDRPGGEAADAVVQLCSDVKSLLAALEQAGEARRKLVLAANEAMDMAEQAQAERYVLAEAAKFIEEAPCCLIDDYNCRFDDKSESFCQHAKARELIVGANMRVMRQRSERRKRKMTNDAKMRAALIAEAKEIFNASGSKDVRAFADSVREFLEQEPAAWLYRKDGDAPASFMRFTRLGNGIMSDRFKVIPLYF